VKTFVAGFTDAGTMCCTSYAISSYANFTNASVHPASMAVMAAEVEAVVARYAK